MGVENFIGERQSVDARSMRESARELAGRSGGREHHPPLVVSDCGDNGEFG
jgi:hypothetical protein